nr:MAG TPA: hypothetical protein [Caudoviricetes sp.]
MVFLCQYIVFILFINTIYSVSILQETKGTLCNL